ncbi:MAG TPA: hypothetical protein EYP24_05820 [bacterium (Candidatus Stahlbacteria)]|nr:hypothetical protein [Candidatus Stahlbacteria bacterium]
MVDLLIEHLKNWLTEIKTRYGINPVIFAIIYFAGVVPFWYSIYRIGRGLKKGDRNEVLTFGTILGTIIISPFFYVLAFGRNLPFWFWIIAALVISFSAYSTRKRIRPKGS